MTDWGRQVRSTESKVFNIFNKINVANNYEHFLVG